MKAYKALPRVVLAAVIIAVHAAGSESAPGFMADLTLDDGSKFSADGAMTIRHWPQPGDYLVKTENPDGSAYYYLNPKDVFEEKYAEVASVELAGQAPLTPEQIAAFTGNDQQPLPPLDLGDPPVGETVTNGVPVPAEGQPTEEAVS